MSLAELKFLNTVHMNILLFYYIFQSNYKNFLFLKILYPSLMALSHEYRVEEVLRCLKKITRLTFARSSLSRNLLAPVFLSFYIFSSWLEIKNKSRLHRIFKSAESGEIQKYLRNTFLIAAARHSIVTFFDLSVADIYGSSLIDSLTMHMSMEYPVFKSKSLGGLLKEQFEKGESASSFLYTFIFELFEKFFRINFLIYELGRNSTTPAFKYGLIAGSLLHFLIYFLFLKTSNWYEGKYLKSKVKVSSVITNETSNFDVVKCFNLEEKSAVRVKEAAERQRSSKMRLEKIGSTVRYFYRFLEISSIAFFYCVYYFDSIDSSDLTSMQKQLVELYESLRAVLKNITDINKYFFTFYTLETKLDGNQIVDPKENEGLIQDQINIEIENLTVETLFSNLSFKIGRNEKIAIVGANNTGKTTFMRILVGLSGYQGQIRINGTELDRISRKDLCSQISYVSQNTCYIQGTVMENLQYGNSLTEDEIVERCKEFQVHEIFSGLKGGYDKVSATVGADLSGGQRQRVNVMRGVLKSAPTLVVDECFSGISTHDKNVIIEKLLSLDDRTLIVATNDLGLLHRFDKILLLNGEKSTSGSFSDLKDVLTKGVEL